MHRSPSTQTVRLVVQRRTVLGDRILEPYDVIDFNVATGEMFVAAGLPFDPAGLRELLARGEVEPDATTNRADTLARLGGAAPQNARPHFGGLRLVTHEGE